MILTLLSLAQAIDVAAREGPCPVGEGTVRVYEKRSDNNAGGWDSDLAAYSSGGQWRTYHLSTCSDNLLSLYGEDLLALDASERERLAKALPLATVGMDPKSTELWDRYRVASRLYTTLGKDDRFIGDLLLEASWAARDAAVGFYPALQGPVQARQLLDAGWEELKKPLSATDRRKVLYNLARVAHRGGWPDERDALLASYEATGGLSADEQKALVRFRYIGQTVEPALQDEVIERYVRVLRTQLSHEDKSKVSYILADLLRRRGRLREAAPLFALILNDGKTADELRGMAMFLVEPISRKLQEEESPK